MKIFRLSILLILWTQISGYSMAADCNDAQSLYKSALHQTDPAKKIMLLEKTVQLCPTFNGFYELGKAFLLSESPEKAEKQFLQANRHAGSLKTQAKAFCGLGYAYEAMGLKNDALMRLRDAKRMDPENQLIAQKWFKVESARIGQIQTAKEIIKDIIESRAVKSGLPIRLSFHVNFEFDKYRFTPKGKDQVQSLAVALADKVNNATRFIIDGYTDSQGTQKYNLELSKKRALQVKKFIVDHTSVTEDRLVIMAFGESRPLSLKNDEQSHAINRRVEIRCLPM